MVVKEELQRLPSGVVHGLDILTVVNNLLNDVLMMPPF
jgi:hypothetical protein